MAWKNDRLRWNGEGPASGRNYLDTLEHAIAVVVPDDQAGRFPKPSALGVRPR